MTFAWERLADGVFRCRLPFLDVTGTTLTEARGIAEDVQDIANREISHIVLTHNHFDHILGTSAFDGAATYCAPEVATTMAERTDHLCADAVRNGADAGEVDGAIAALRVPEHQVTSPVVDLGDRTVAISHPGRGHTGHDLIAVVTGSDRPVVFCGDLVEESGDPAIGADSDPVEWPATLARVIDAGGEDAVFVPGHGAVVDAAFIYRQQGWLRKQV
jgi:glyoxylase-like metal-dependent hydrolase (beta-lactamase superfamily II)